MGGVQSGWTMTSFDGMEVESMRYKAFFRSFQESLARLPLPSGKVCRGLAMVFKTPQGPTRIVLATRRPLEMMFETDMVPVIVTEATGHAMELGIKPGWV